MENEGMLPNDNDKTQIASFAQKTSAVSGNSFNLIGKKIANRYLIEELIGQGGMSYIYRARDSYLETNQTEQHIVVKVLQEQFNGTPEAISLLKEEASRSQQLAHPNIVKVYHADTFEDIHYVVMEWIEGETLEQVIKRNKPHGLKMANAKAILNQLLDALIYAHDKRIIHNDLKPSNVMFNASGSLKVMDFGIAKEKSNEDIYAYQQKSNEDNLAGYTPAYASPEQLNGSDATVTDDIYSFGCIAYELLCSNAPYDRVAANKLEDNVKLVKPKNCPIFFWSTLKACLNLTAENRPQDFKSIKKSLNRRYLPAVAASIGVLSLSGMGYGLVNAQQSNSLQLQAELENAHAKYQQLESWMGWRNQNVVARLAEIPPQYDVLKHGLLKVNQDVILAKYEEQAKAIPRQAKGFKDFDAMLAVYEKAKMHFEDSLALSDLITGLKTERQSILENKGTRLSLLLDQSRYNEQGQNNIANLVTDLKIVNDKFKFRPEVAHVDNFIAAIDTAIAEDDFVAQKNLVDVGKIIFSESKSAKSKLDYMLEREKSIIALERYNKAKAQGQDVPYPTEEAIVFFDPRFETYSSELQAITDHKELVKYEESINLVAANYPYNFPPMINLKKEISKRYISMASELMKKRMYRTAERLIQRGNSITQSLDTIL